MELQHKNITFTIELVTPTIAAKYLEKNVLGNRAANDKKAMKYSATMAADEWAFTHQGIAFDENGKLFDGQHRLRGIVLSGKPQYMVVARGFHPDTIKYVDEGWNRTVQSFMNGQYKDSRAALARFIMSAESFDGYLSYSAVYARTDLSRQQILEKLDSDVDLTEYGVQYAPTAAALGGKFPGVSTSAMLLSGYVAGAKKSQWFDDIQALVNASRVLDAGNPALALWKSGVNNPKVGTAEYAMKAAYAAYKYRLGEDLTTIRITSKTRIKVS